jgi:hypothetical protein
MMLERNGEIPNARMLHQMVHSSSSRKRKRTISESNSSESECKSQSPSINFEDQLDHQSKELISNVHKAFKETLDV